jgi:tetratricopeptide (TPR) repeat protein
MRSTIQLLSENRKEFPNGRQLAGDFYYRLGDLDSAYKEYEASVKENRDDRFSSQRKMVEVLAFQGRNQEATHLAQQLVEEHPDDDTAKALRASLRLRGGDAKELDTAVSEFQSVIARMPDNPVVRYNYAEALLAKGKRPEAKIQLQEAIKLRSSYVPPRVALMRVHMAERDFPKVIALADGVLKQAPRLADARILRAAALMGTRDVAGSRGELAEVLKVYPENKDAKYLLAMLDFSEKRFKEAEEGFRALWEANPPDQRGLFGLVEVQMAQSRPADARQILDKALASKPSNAAAIRMAIANVGVRSRQYDEAIGIYKDLVKEMPKSQEMWHRLGETYRRAGRFEEAYQAFETGKNIDPQKVRMWLDLAIVLENMNKKDQLRPIYEQILKLEPDNPVALNNLAYMLADSGIELNQALSYAQRAKQKMPNHVDIADTLGWVYIKKNLSDDAIKIFRDLLVQKPDHVTWRYHLAMALVQKGDKLQARKELELALRNKPTKDEESKIRDLLSRIS